MNKTKNIDMNKSMSRYYSTALLMNQAFIELLNKKDFEFITVKEICLKAGVNRSTFYLHYETINDLLTECIENINKHFTQYFGEESQKIISEIHSSPKEKLILISPKYLTPYLTYIKQNKIVFNVAVKHANIMNSHKTFDSLNNYVFRPIFERFGINKKEGDYMIAYYISGVTAIVNKWIQNNCEDEIEYITKIIMDCVLKSY